MGNRSYKWLIRIAILLLTLLCLFIVLKLSPIWTPVVQMIGTVLIPIIISGFITYLLHPIVEWLHHRGLSRTVAILSIYLLFFGGIGFGLYKLIPQMMNQLKELSENLPNLTKFYEGWMNEIESQTENFPIGIHQRVEEGIAWIETTIDQGIEMVTSFFKGVISSIVIIAIIPFIVFYMLKDMSKFSKAIWYMTPRSWRRPGIQLLKEIDESLGNYIRGQLFVCLIIGVAATAGFWMSGISYPLILGGIIGATNIIPYFGPIIGAIPAVIVASTMSLKMVLIILVIIFLLQFLEGNVLAPFIVGKSLRMHPVVIIIALLIGEEIAGIVGLIVSVPVLAVLREIIIHFKLYFEKQTELKNG